MYDTYLLTYLAFTEAGRVKANEGRPILSTA